MTSASSLVKLRGKPNLTLPKALSRYRLKFPFKSRAPHVVQKNKADRTSKLNEAQNAGITFRKTVQNELIDAARSSMLDGVSNTKVWNAKHITSRSLRLSEICWDLFIGWLNEN